MPADTPQPLLPSSRTWGRYLTIYAALWKNSIVREMGFKTNFLLWIVVEMLWFALQLSFMFVIYSHTDRIGTWSKWQVVMLLGASHFIQQIFTAIFLTNCTQLSELIRTGKLDFMLLLPVNTRFMISFRQVDLGGFVNAASGIAVMIYAGNQLRLSTAWAQVIGFVLLAAVSILVHYSLMFLLASVSFRTVRAQGIVWGYYNLFNIARLPDEAFRGIVRRSAKVEDTWVDAEGIRPGDPKGAVWALASIDVQSSKGGVKAVESRDLVPALDPQGNRAKDSPE